MPNELDKDAFFRVQSNSDAWLRLFGVMTEEELERAVRGCMNIYVIAEFEFKRRFPEAYAKYEKEFDE